MIKLLLLCHHLGSACEPAPEGLHLPGNLMHPVSNEGASAQDVDRFKQAPAQSMSLEIKSMSSLSCLSQHSRIY